MDMIRHHHERFQFVAGTIEVPQRTRHHVRALCLPQTTLALARIQPRVKTRGEALVEFVPLVIREPIDFPGMGQTVNFEPGVPFALPEVEFFAWYRISEAEGDEAGDPVLLPMREMVPVFDHRLREVRRTKGHGSG
jgi:hypothetical protein